MNLRVVLTESQMAENKVAMTAFEKAERSVASKAASKVVRRDEMRGGLLVENSAEQRVD